MYNSINTCHVQLMTISTIYLYMCNSINTRHVQLMVINITHEGLQLLAINAIACRPTTHGYKQLFGVCIL